MIIPASLAALKFAVVLVSSLQSNTASSLTVPCQQRVSDGYIELFGNYLPDNIKSYQILHYTVTQPSDGVWTSGSCNITLTYKALPQH